jgi:hypothetical protein
LFQLEAKARAACTSTAVRFSYLALVTTGHLPEIGKPKRLFAQPSGAALALLDHVPDVGPCRLADERHSRLRNVVDQLGCLPPSKEDGPSNPLAMYCSTWIGLRPSKP